MKVPEAVEKAFMAELDTVTYDDFDLERALEAALERLREELEGYRAARESVQSYVIRAALNSVLGDKEEGR